MPWKGFGRCCAVGCVRIGASHKRNSRSIWGFSSSFTTCESEAKRCWERSLSYSSQKTLDSNKRVVPYGLRHSAGAGAGSDLDIGGQQPQHALLAEATQEGPHRIGVRVRGLSSLGGCAFGKQYERADQFVAPLDLVHKLELELRKIPRWFHGCSLLLAPLGPPSGAMMVGVRPSQWTATCSVQEGQVARVPTAGVWGLPCQERGPIVAAHEEASHGYPTAVLC